MADINFGAITEALNNKVDLPMGDSQDGIDFVVDWQRPTSDNGYTWYRKYKSGWVEQGGYIEPKNVTWTETVVLPVPFEDLYYNIALGALEPGADKAYVRYVHVTAYDETTITMTGSYMNTTNNIGCFWSACGMIA